MKEQAKSKQVFVSYIIGFQRGNQNYGCLCEPTSLLNPGIISLVNKELKIAGIEI
jgi:hypothetical protein